LVTHGLQNLKYVDTIYVMDNGRIVEQGCYEDLVKKQGVLASLILAYVQEKSKRKTSSTGSDVASDINSSSDSDEDHGTFYA